MMNLLPKEKQEELFYSKMFHSIVVAFQIGFIILLLGLMTQIVLYVYLDNESKNTEAMVLNAKTETGKKEYADQRAQVRVVNTKMRDFQTLLDNTPKWSSVFNAFAKNIPPDVKITTFTANRQTKKVQIQGVSPTRELVIQLYNNINNDKEFFNGIDYPLENVTKPLDVSFKFTFNINEGILGTAEVATPATAVPSRRPPAQPALE